MADFYFSAPSCDGGTLCLAPLTERRRLAASSDVPDASGYFLFEQRGRGESAEIEILARVDTEEAALRLREILNLD